ncbi:hypothetical protein NLG97_g5301 [Lecanicillium saksenae]|uniref:Uncharacterized protein n=1 Tax=Lecanicillium saksenae TaxID=468837 RepID=A0ACC1QU03_9HYPO|nr:hypothetical protein NLG97_g5301 [Lecanicillium saksenae]
MQANDTAKRWLHLPGSKKQRDDSTDMAVSEIRLPFIGFMPNKFRNHFVATIGEFTGTFLFLFCAFAATQVANTALKGAQSGDDSIASYPNTDTLTYIALSFGFSLAVNAWIFFRISGGLFNPAVTLALCLVGAVGWVRGCIITAAQILGGTAAAAVVSCLFPGTLQVATALGGGTTTVQGLFIEALLTAQLILTIIMLAAEKHKATFLAPIGIGLSLFVAEMTGVYFTGGSLNPARSFGPCVVLHKFPGYHWIYWVGPGIGATIAAAFYHLVKVLEYETANPGADFNELEMDRFAFDEEKATGADAQRPDITSPPLSPSVAGYRGRSSSHLRPTSPNSIGVTLNDSHSSRTVMHRSENASPPLSPSAGIRRERSTSNQFRPTSPNNNTNTGFHMDDSRSGSTTQEPFSSHERMASSHNGRLESATRGHLAPSADIARDQ